MGYTERSYKHRIKVLDKKEITNSAKFVAAIREVLEDERCVSSTTRTISLSCFSYRTNAKRVSAMLHKRPFTAKEQLIKYTEFAAEFGPSKALRPQSHDMNWIEYHNLVSRITEIKNWLSISRISSLLEHLLLSSALSFQSRLSSL